MLHDVEGSSRAASLPIQPAPIEMALSYSTSGRRTETVIARTWADGDPARCTLCPLGYCGAGSGRLCIVRVDRRVEPEDAWTFRAERVAEGTSPFADDPRIVARRRRRGRVGQVCGARRLDAGRD